MGGWEIAPIYTYQSGQWVTAQSGIDSNLNGDSAGDRTISEPEWRERHGQRSHSTVHQRSGGLPSDGDDANANTPAGRVVGYLADNPNAQYIEAGYGALANVGRNTLQLKPINDVDISALKRFSITERFKVEFRASATNALQPRAVRRRIPQRCCAAESQRSPALKRNMLLPDNPSFNNPSAVFSSNPRTMQLVLKIFF